MAQTMYCDGCETRPAVVSIQNLSEPVPLMFCPYCAVDFMEAFVAITKGELGIETPAADGSAASGELGAGGDTPNIGVTPDRPVDPAALPADTAQAGGGDDDGSVSVGDRGLPGGSPDGAGGAGPDLGEGGAAAPGGSGEAGDGAGDGRDSGRSAQSASNVLIGKGP